MKPTIASVVKAMYRYNNWGATKFFSRYSSGRAPRGHYLKYEGERYPLKALWAAAHVPTIHTRDFQTPDAAKGFKALGIGKPVYVSAPMEYKGTEDEREAEGDVEIEAQKRQLRLAIAPRVPSVTTREIVEFIRNPDVVAEVLYRAQGFCEMCGEQAPFLRGSDGTPYLEVHHVRRLAEGGEDTVDNAVGVCPNCHRQAHFG